MDDLWLGIPAWLRNPPFFKQKCSKVSKLYVLHLGGTLTCYVFVLRHVCFLLTALMANHDWRPPFSVLISGNYWMKWYHGCQLVNDYVVQKRDLVLTPVIWDEFVQLSCFKQKTTHHSLAVAGWREFCSFEAVWPCRQWKIPNWNN